MAQRMPRKPLVAVLLLLLVASLAANVLLYRKGSRPLFEEGDRPLIERTIALSPRMSLEEDTRTVTFPIVMSWGDRTCVELRRYDAWAIPAPATTARGG